MTNRVEQVEPPAASLVSKLVPQAHYEDTFFVRLPQGTFADVDALARACLHFPRWVDALMGLRNALVAPFGLKTEPDADQRSPVPRSGAFAPGETAGIFRVFERSVEELLLGENDRHLDFRFSLLLRQQGAFQEVFATTTVNFHNVWGRLYFLFVAPFHRLIIPAMLRSAIAHV